MDDFCSVVVGIAITALALFVFSHINESSCQQKHNVADCEMVVKYVPAERSE